MFCAVATGAPAFITFRSLWLGATSSVAVDSGGELGMEVTKLVTGGLIVFGDSNSSLLGIGFVIGLSGWESTVSDTGD